MTSMGARQLQVGRDVERKHLAAALQDSARGRPRAVLVAGEPGIGKTSLVTEVTTGPAGSGHQVLWGRCLRFGAESSPFLPIGQMLTQWHRRSDESERSRVLAGAEAVATIAPALGQVSGSVEPARVLPLVAAVLDRIAQTDPVVLVLDDAQWADATSLDLLAYLMAGFGGDQRLCLLVTYRDTDLADGHRLHGWLADAVRLPSVSRLRLERLGYADAEELVSRLRGTDASDQLAARLFERSAGNPYYTELLVRGSSGEPGTDPSDDLRAALLSAWHRLDHDTRELLQLLALGGRPVAVGVLERLVVTRGGSREQVASSLAEATAAGMTIVGPDGAAWFHHPLVAEVVAATVPHGASRQVHREYAAVIESAADLTVASRAAHLALHHHQAGDPDPAFAWSLRAADEAAAVRGYAEVYEHLRRACLLWDEIGEATRAAAGDRVDLWWRTSRSAWSAGEFLQAIDLREEAISLVEDDDDPVRAVRLRLPLCSWRHFCGLDAQVSVDATRAVLELAGARCPGTPEHVQALARHAHAELWNEMHSAVPHAAAAVRMARRTGSAEALAWALAVRSQTPPWDRALADATDSLALAREVGDPVLLSWATVATANRLDVLGHDTEAAELLLTTFRTLADDGSIHDGMFSGVSWGTLVLLDLGRWREVRELLRLLLSHRLAPGPGAVTRGVAALLALRTGDASAARTHLARARELHPSTPRPGELLGVIELEAHAALGEQRRALELAAQMMPAQARLDPGGADEFLVIAARAAADLAEQPGCRDAAVALLDRVESERCRDVPWFEPSGPEDLIHPARGCLFAAERARCHGATETATRWRQAVDTCQAAGLVWHEALASYRLARALLGERRSRSDAASALRHAARLAGELGAGPILRDVEELALQAHISLAEPEAHADTSERDGVISSLTSREREVLSHLVAGRTYAEIAQALFISEKTVSVHVSNLLRKTGTRSRLEVADLVRRTSAVP